MESTELSAKLAEADSTELAALVEEHLAELDLPAVRQILRNPFVTTEILSALMGNRRLLGIHEVRRGLARHPQILQVHAMRLISTLFWRDLMELGLDPKVAPVVRRGADRQLVNRLQGLAVGERMAVARRASHGVLVRLRFDSQAQVIGAFLENPRMTQGLLLPLVASESAAPEILRLISENRRWGVLYPIRQALVRNPRTPPIVAMNLLPHLKKIDRQAVARDRRLSPALRQKARKLAGDGASSR